MAALVWIAFLSLTGLLFAVDLGAFRRRSEAVSIRESLAWTGFWIALALAFGVLLTQLYGHHWLGFGTFFETRIEGPQAGLEFLTGYLIEKSLSIDNVLFIALVFAHFQVPLRHQHRVLFWGVLGALFLRGAMIAAGTALIEQYAWVEYGLGLALLTTAVKLLITRHDNLEPDRNWLVRSLKRRVDVTDETNGDRFTLGRGSRGAGRPVLVPLGVCMAVVASADVIFAIDAIPAIFAVTRDPFLVFTSNVFAVLGLRALYFALAGMIERLRYFKSSLAFLLLFVGVKMLLQPRHEIDVVVTLIVTLATLGIGVIASLAATQRDADPLASPLAADLDRLLRVSLRQARRIVILIVGSTVLLLGVAMIVLPGPAFVVIPAGLGILAVEFVWARRWLLRLRQTMRKIEDRVRNRRRRPQANGPESPPASDSS